MYFFNFIKSKGINRYAQNFENVTDFLFRKNFVDPFEEILELLKVKYTLS